MKTKSKKPIPTEYKGVRFRSKSEAIFARHLDLCKIDWVYEPDTEKTDYWIGGNHKWDFRIQAIVFNTVLTCYVEFKPTKPTDTYVQNLISNVNSDYDFSIVSRLLENHTLVSGTNQEGEFTRLIKSIKGAEIESKYFDFLRHINQRDLEVWSWTASIVVAKNFFEDSEFSIIEIETGTWKYSEWACLVDIISCEEKARQAKSYRFDLEQ